MRRSSLPRRRTNSPRSSRKANWRCALPLTGSILALTAVQSSGADAVHAALEGTRPIVDLRLRAEEVSQEGLARDASAITLRGRIGFETGKLRNTSLLAETELLWPLTTDYNSTTNGKTSFPVVADPQTRELNRLQLTNTSLPATTLIVGRQRINLDDQRFIGAVGWRQNEQTFDALRIVNTALKKVTVDLTYLDQVNRVFGKDSAAGRYTGHNYLANLLAPTPLGKLTAFAYRLDLKQAPTDSSQTLGARLTDQRTAGSIRLAYALSYARQQDRGNNPIQYSADQYAAELTGTWRRFSLGGGVEVLGGDGVKGFTAPLATLHKFQGWADKFLTTPANGIDDRYLTLGYARTGEGFFDTLNATATYHWFQADRLGIDYGAETDLQLQVKRRRLTALLKYADYRSEGFATDTRKWWLQLEYVR